MPEQRARAHHRNRVANTFSDEIGSMLEGELSDPRIAPSYVTNVVLAPGGKSAIVFVAVEGTRAEEDSTLEGLMAARAFIRSQIRERMGVRHVPELTFAIDRSEKMTGRVDELLARSRRRGRKLADTVATDIANAQPAPDSQAAPAAQPAPADQPNLTGARNS